MKTFRKSSLITSVALLLVAIVALSGATFAWFAANTSATATGISIKSGSASGLLISQTGNVDDWGSSVTFAAAETALVPTSTFDFTNWYTALSDDPTDYVANKDGYTADGAKDTHYKEYNLYAMTADGSEQELTISTTALTDAGDYGRIAIVRGSEVKVYYMDSDTTAAYPIMKDAETGNGVVATAYPKATADNTISNISLGKIDGNSTAFKIYVWNEGQDMDCKSVNAAKALSVDFQLSITPVATEPAGE